MNESPNNDEIKRRLKVADEKMAGFVIENIERLRNKPMTQSIAMRLYELNDFMKLIVGIMHESFKNMWAFSTPSPFLTNQTNLIIRIYNNIIEYLQTNLRKKDAFIDSFNSIDELNNPQLKDVIDMIFKLKLNINQIFCYLIRWASPK